MKKLRKDKIIFVVVIILILISIIVINESRNWGKVNVKELNIKSDEERVQEKISKYETAKEFGGISGFINSEEFSIEENIGKKVILIDFWTYSCVNCQRTLPYLTSWDEKYKDEGLLIIGVHSPEFAFEKDYDNVVNAVVKYNIGYPVVQDNNFETWRSYRNRYWPRKYLIDIDGFIVYDHIGEGAYEETERKIQELLEERNSVLGEDNFVNKYLTEDVSGDKMIGTPELYFGYGFYRGNIGNIEGIKPETFVEYKLPRDIEKNTFNLEGEWFNDYDYMKLESDNGKIILDFYAKEVNIVAGSSEINNINVKLDDKEIGNFEINGNDLYNLVNLGEPGRHVLEINTNKGFRIYTFTFG